MPSHRQGTVSRQSFKLFKSFKNNSLNVLSTEVTRPSLNKLYKKALNISFFLFL